MNLIFSAALAGLCLSFPVSVAQVTDQSESSSVITLSNHITACPDKVQREQQLLLTFLEQVKKNEPGVLEFELSVASANNSFLTYEKYANQAAIDKHLNTTYFKELIAAEQKEGTKCAPNEVLFGLNKIFSLKRPGA